jgi:hypothetical protein
MFVNLVWRGSAVVQSDDATAPHPHPRPPPHVERAHALRPVDLVAADPAEISPRGRVVWWREQKGCGARRRAWRATWRRCSSR